MVLVSGYPPGGRMVGVPEAALFVRKPFRGSELTEAVERALLQKTEH